MKKSSIFSVLVLSLFLMVNPTKAHAGAQLSLVGAASLGLLSSDVTTVAGSVSLKGGLGYGGGLLAGFGAMGNGLEIGALYLSRVTKSTVLGTETKNTYGFLHVPVMFRFGSTVSLGLGGYYDIGISANAGSVYGLTVGPRIKFSKLFLDTRFNLDLKSSTANNELLFMLGYMF